MELPFTKTEKDTEPNMITIRNKKHVSQHPDFQIWRETNEDNDYFVTGLGHITDPTKIQLPQKFYNGNYMIEMWCDEDSVC